jgi:uncharacterized protein (TIRG00374 family)
MRQLFRHFSNSHSFNWLLKLALTLLAFWFALRGVDIAHVADILETQHHQGVVWTVVFLLAQVVLGALRWHKILRAIAMAGERIFDWFETIKLYYISVFFNCCLPGTVGGDVVRVWLIKSDALSLHTSIASVVIDRLIALLALAVLVVVTLPRLGIAAGFDAAFWLPVLVLAGLFGLWSTLRMKPFLQHAKHLRPVRWLIHFIDCLQLMIDRPKASLVALVYAILSHICFCLCIYALARGLNVELTVIECITLVPLVMLAMTIPISIGGWGVREMSMVGMLGLAGVPKAAALMISLEYGIVNILTCLPAAALWLAYRKHKKVDLKQSLVT